MTAEISTQRAVVWAQRTGESPLLDRSFRDEADRKMSCETLNRSEVFGRLRRELYGDELSSHNTHIFIIFGASVSIFL